MIRHLLTTSCLLTVVSSCSFKPPPPVTHDSLSAQQLALVKDTPVVDIHVHTFNSKFLPTEGVALGKRDAHWLLAFAADPIVYVAVQLIDSATEINRSQSKSFEFEDFNAQGQTVRDIARRVKAQFPDKNTPSAKDIASHPLTRGLAKVLTTGGGELSFIEKQFVRGFGMFFASGHGETIFRGLDTKYDRSLVHFIKRITSGEHQIIDKYLHDQGQPISLFVSHMMDLAPVYDQQEGTRLLYDWDKIVDKTRMQQRKVNKEGKTKMLYFVAYNPFRDYWRGGNEGDALALVQRAYRTKGAAGIKVYPPSGYRAAANQIKNRVFAPFNPHAHRQYRARYYDHGNKISDDTLNNSLDALFKWASDENVPIFTHSGVGEFEARKGYGVYHSDPEYWEIVLKKYPNLRLCFGHAGGEAYWFKDTKKHADWGERVERLCRTYRNVYCEFGAFGGIADAKHRKNFVATIINGINKSGVGTSQKYPFADKVIYGSDYYMPLTSGHSFADYLKAFQLAGVAIQGDGQGKRKNFYAKFFHLNAKAYLKHGRVVR